MLAPLHLACQVAWHETCTHPLAPIVHSHHWHPTCMPQTWQASCMGFLGIHLANAHVRRIHVAKPCTGFASTFAWHGICLPHTLARDMLDFRPKSESGSRMPYSGRKFGAAIPDIGWTAVRRSWGNVVDSTAILPALRTATGPHRHERSGHLDRSCPLTQFVLHFSYCQNPYRHRSNSRHANSNRLSHLQPTV